MSDQRLGRYHFIAWARRGIGAAVTGAGAVPLPARAAVSVRHTITAQQSGGPVNVTPPPENVLLYGPGDVIGIDPRHVIRTEPRNFTSNFEPNYFAGIE